MDILPLVVDGIVILIFVACIFDGYRRGFIKMLLSIASVALSIVIANAFSAPLAQWANDEFVDDAVSEYVDKYIDNMLESAGTSSEGLAGVVFENSEERIIESLPEELIEILDRHNISAEDILRDISFEDNAETVSEKITSNIKRKIIQPILKMFAFLLIYIVCSIIFSIIVNVISSMFRLPVIKGINKSLGAALGTIQGIAVIGVVCVFAVLAASFLPGNEIADAVSEAVLTNTVNDIAIDLIS